MSAGVQEASIARVPQFMPPDQSAGISRSPLASWLPAFASGSFETASITIALPHKAMSSLIRLRSSSENRYSSRRLGLAEMNHHRWGEWCLGGITGKAKEKPHVSILSDLLDGLLIGQAKPLLDEQRTKRRLHRHRRGASSWVELRCICFFWLFPLHQGGEEYPAVVRVQRAAKRHMKLLD